MLAPSKTGATGPLPVAKVEFTVVPVTRILLTVLSLKLVIQTCVPSKAHPRGRLPTGTLANTALLLRGYFETRALLKLPIQRFTPSKQAAIGCALTPIVKPFSLA